MKWQQLLKFRTCYFWAVPESEKCSRHFVQYPEGINSCQSAKVRLRTGWDIFSHAGKMRESHAWAPSGAFWCNFQRERERGRGFEKGGGLFFIFMVDCCRWELSWIAFLPSLLSCMWRCESLATLSLSWITMLCPMGSLLWLCTAVWSIARKLRQEPLWTGTGAFSYCSQAGTEEGEYLSKQVSKSALY